MTATALTIAGSDPSGGAGIQADLKTFSANGVYGMSALTALTAQNTQGVSAVQTVAPDFVIAQIRDVLADIPVGAVKIGMIATAEIAEAVASALTDYTGSIVLDPVMVAKGGHPLLPAEAVHSLETHLLPRATVLTPNLPEAAAILGVGEATNEAQMIDQGKALIEMGPLAVLVKGGHLDGPESTDVLVTQDGVERFTAPRVATRNTHGTGCTLSAAIAAELAKGAEIIAAVTAAKTYLTGAVAAADSLNIGNGHGPTHHFHAIWPNT
jgi:hydroxymethylpyrimidine/phosphomethylpyrimidine kinase